MRRFVAQDAESRGGSSNSIFTLDGYVCATDAQGAWTALVSVVSPAAKWSGAVCDCVTREYVPCVLTPARELFQTILSIGFFCNLPHDPTKTFIRCERIPQ